MLADQKRIPVPFHMLKGSRPRCQQDSNLRGDNPMDFESIALTIQPRQPRAPPVVLGKS